MTYDIEVRCLRTPPGVDEEWVRRRVSAVLSAELVDHAELSVALVDDEEIHRVNREHLDHDWPTDVISFPYSARRISPDQPLAELEGELVVSVETAEREAVRFGWSTSDELTLYLVHGALHLCGYDDLEESLQQRMRVRERELLKNWNLTPHYGE